MSLLLLFNQAENASTTVSFETAALTLTANAFYCVNTTPATAQPPVVSFYDRLIYRPHQEIQKPKPEPITVTFAAQKLEIRAKKFKTLVSENVLVTLEAQALELKPIGLEASIDYDYERELEEIEILLLYRRLREPLEIHA